MLQFFLSASQPVNVSCDCAVQADFNIFMHLLPCLPEKLKSPHLFVFCRLLNNYCKMETNNKFQGNVSDC